VFYVELLFWVRAAATHRLFQFGDVRGVRQRPAVEDLESTGMNSFVLALLPGVSGALDHAAGLPAYPLRSEASAGICATKKGSYVKRW
jgi:hypothetical protein